MLETLHCKQGRDGGHAGEKLGYTRLNVSYNLPQTYFRLVVRNLVLRLLPFSEQTSSQRNTHTTSLLMEHCFSQAIRFAAAEYET